jgi:hypothetical protein
MSCGNFIHSYDLAGMNPDAKPCSQSKPSVFDHYWKEIGGLEGVFRSKYWKWSLLFTALCFPLWVRAGWWEIAISVTGTALGFSVGAFGVLYAALPLELRTIMAKASKNGKPAVLFRVALQFFHFILVQIAALGAAVLAKAWYIPELLTYWELDKALAEGGVEWTTYFFKGIAWFLPFQLFSYAVACTLNSMVALGKIVELEVRQAAMAGRKAGKQD